MFVCHCRFIKDVHLSAFESCKCFELFLNTKTVCPCITLLANDMKSSWDWLVLKGLCIVWGMDLDCVYYCWSRGSFIVEESVYSWGRVAILGKCLGERIGQRIDGIYLLLSAFSFWFISEYFGSYDATFSGIQFTQNGVNFWFLKLLFRMWNCVYY